MGIAGSQPRPPSPLGGQRVRNAGVRGHARQRSITSAIKKRAAFTRVRFDPYVLVNRASGHSCVSVPRPTAQQPNLNWRHRARATVAGRANAMATTTTSLLLFPVAGRNGRSACVRTSACTDRL